MITDELYRDRLKDSIEVAVSPELGNIRGYESYGIAHGDEEKGKAEGVHIEGFFRLEDNSNGPNLIHRLLTNKQYLKRKSQYPI